jgi:hypothetical protein
MDACGRVLPFFLTAKTPRTANGRLAQRREERQRKNSERAKNYCGTISIAATIFKSQPARMSHCRIRGAMLFFAAETGSCEKVIFLIL